MNFWVWAYISQDFLQTQQNLEKSHDCMTATFRSLAIDYRAKATPHYATLH